MRKPLVIAIILNYMRANDTIDCIDSLKKSSYSTLHLIVVDNASTDDSVERIRAAYPDIEILRSKINLGYAGGMNLGIRHAFKFSPEYLLIINSDTIADSHYVSKLVDALLQKPKAAAASGTIYYYPDTSKIWYAGGKIKYWRASGFTNRSFLDVNNTSSQDIQDVTFISGCAFLIRVSAIQTIGLFDERFFMYLEDTEMCSRFVNNNFDLLYVRNAILFHKVNHEGELPFPLYFSVRNRLLFLKLSASGFSKTFGFIYLFCVLGLKIVLWSFTKPYLVIAARLGIADYFTGRFYKGRGYQLLDSHKSTKQNFKQ
ncbi:MAG: glycosyltransferase family 2 protein [Bacteroidota bacterium]|nr:glycosyltransferase family 2 protein [Bacteroidota bacterium]